MNKLIFAVPKGRILDELLPLMNTIGINPEDDFFDPNSRKLIFKTSLPNFEIIRVRAFDVATFVAFGAAQIGVAGDDVLREFNYEEIYSVLDLNIGECKLSLAKQKDNQDFEQKKLGNITVATKYKSTVINFFASKGIRAECIKLNGAIELAPKLGMCDYIVDLVSTGKTLIENDLVEQEVLMNITAKLILNKVAFKMMNKELQEVVKKFEKAML